MRILDALLGWTGYDPLDFFQNGVLFTLNYLFGLILYVYTLRPFLRVRPRTFVLLNNLGLLLCYGLFLLVPSLLGSLTGSMRSSLFLFLLVFLPIRLLLVRGRLMQNLFVFAYIICLNFVVLGVSNLIYVRVGHPLPATVGALLALLTRLVLYFLALPVGVRSLRRLFAAWEGSESATIWRAAWLVPAALFFLSWQSGNVLVLSAPHFLASRLLPVTALQFFISLLTDVMGRERETAAAAARARMLDLEGQAIEQSRQATLRAWDRTNAARKKARAVVEGVLAHIRTGGHEREIDALLEAYMGALDAGTAAGVMCENAAVQALASHYAAVAADRDIAVSFRLDIPAEAGVVTNMDLSRVVGNMLENAIEACGRMEYGSRFIRLWSLIRDDVLLLVMDNSFDGDFEETTEGEAVSRKRESGVSTGLSSIRTVARRYSGKVTVRAEGRVFQTSVRLPLQEE